MKGGANVNSSVYIRIRDLHWFILHEACNPDRDVDMDIIQLLVRHGANLENGREGSRGTALGSLIKRLESVDESRLAIAQFLLEAGADPNSPDDVGETPLHGSCNTPNNNVGIIRVLLERGANLEAQCVEGRTTLHVACEYGSLENVRELVSNHQANIFARDYDGKTPFDLAGEALEDDICSFCGSSTSQLLSA